MSGLYHWRTREGPNAGLFRRQPSDAEFTEPCMRASFQAIQTGYLPGVIAFLSIEQPIRFASIGGSGASYSISGSDYIRARELTFQHQKMSSICGEEFDIQGLCSIEG